MQIYKAEEGFWTRVMSAIAYGLVVAMGAVWLFGALASGPRNADGTTGTKNT